MRTGTASEHQEAEMYPSSTLSALQRHVARGRGPHRIGDAPPRRPSPRKGTDQWI